MSTKSTNGDDSYHIGDGPGIGVESLKRRPLTDEIFETSLTPDQCKAILRATRRFDANFRPLAIGVKLAAMSEMMRNDRWVWTDADPIRLHLHVESGEVVCTDGQHRLFSATKSRRVLHTVVMWGDRWRAGVHVDRNRTRSVGQYLAHEHGIGSAPVYAAAVRLHLGRLFAYEQNVGINHARGMVDDQTIIQFVLDHHDDLQWAINRGTAAGTRGFSTTGTHVFLYELLTISREIAEQFQSDLLDNNLDVNDPLARLRQTVTRRFNDTGIRSSVYFTLANLVKAHNLRSAGDTLSKWIPVNGDEVVLPAGFKIDGKRVRSTNR